MARPTKHEHNHSKWAGDMPYMDRAPVPKELVWNLLRSVKNAKNASPEAEVFHHHFITITINTEGVNFKTWLHTNPTNPQQDPVNGPLNLSIS